MSSAFYLLLVSSECKRFLILKTILYNVKGASSITWPSIAMVIIDVTWPSIAVVIIDIT